MDTRKIALNELEVFCKGFIPSTVANISVTAKEGIEIANDLKLLAARVDRVVAAYGEFMDDVSTVHVDQALFKDQLLDALSGNAIYEIEEAAAETERDESQPDPDRAYDEARDRRMEAAQ